MPATPRSIGAGVMQIKNVGASLLAIAVWQATLMFKLIALSRAGSLPQVPYHQASTSSFVPVTQKLIEALSRAVNGAPWNR
ncbi:hypothetical protein D3C78_1888940 [compost metagenome]